MSFSTAAVPSGLSQGLQSCRSVFPSSCRQRATNVGMKAEILPWERAVCKLHVFFFLHCSVLAYWIQQVGRAVNRIMY